MKCLFACLALAVLPSLSRGEEARVFFETRIRPILSRCVSCHGGEDSAGGLDLTTSALARKGGESGPAFKPGQAGASLLIRMVESKKMPPKKPLTPAEIADLRRWIDTGAAWEGTITRVSKEKTRAGLDWWSLQPVRAVTPPVVGDRAWARNPLDTFILAQLEQRKLKPAPEADRRTLIRRLYFDLLGLPPSPEEIEAFVEDRRPDAYERLVEKLLASPQHGERLARGWLDLARYCESQGFERDKPRDHAWRYRDYVIRSLNADRSYLKFVAEQIAGDVLDPENPDGIIATGFLVAGPWDEVGATQQSQIMRRRVREEELEDMIAAVGQTFLGLTVNCARCHDHKFDPISQKDYYRLKAALEGVRPGDRDLLTPAVRKAREQTLQELTRKIDRLEQELSSLRQAALKALESKGLDPSPGPLLRSLTLPARLSLPEPLARWSFEGDVRDSAGTLHGTLVGKATVRDGRLQLDGQGSFVRTTPLKVPLRAKTLEAWVFLANLTQRGGGVIALETQDGKVFDAIVFGERQPGKWIAGSDFFRRTRDFEGPAEKAGPHRLVHVAVVYDVQGGITLYRDGEKYGTYTLPGQSPVSFAAGEARILLGLRHTGAGNGFFTGAIEEARLYDRALSADEVRASFRAGVARVPLEKLLAAMSPRDRERYRQTQTELEQLRRSDANLTVTGKAYAANPMTPPATHVLARGEVDRPGERVSAGGLSALRTIPAEWGLTVDADEGQRRLKLAAWIAHPSNPLTARVVVNRLWQHHFGLGLVATPSDFGWSGERPTHPELLDWLAQELARAGWSLKHLHRLIVTSATYRQSSRWDPQAATLDAETRLLWRFPPRRLEAEATRDAMLAVSGQLNPQMGGPSFRPFTMRVFNSTFYDLLDPPGPEFNRRTIYRMNVVSARSPLLDSLDCPEPSVKTPRRAVTTTPLQALSLMNNSFVLRQAKHLAQRAGAGDLAGRVDRVFRLALGRPPTRDEARLCVQTAQEHGLETVCWALLNCNEFIYLR